MKLPDASLGQHSPRTLEMAHVLFMDIVSYSQLSMDEQTRLIGLLQQIVRNSAKFDHAKKRHQLLRLPTGDGMALVFFGDAEAPAHCALEISRALPRYPELKLRMGIHTGPVQRVEDINANRNVAGSGINLAQRVMDCGDAGHILVSRTVADVLGHMSSWGPMLHELGKTQVKHGVCVHLYNLYTDDAGNKELPRKLVEARAKGKWQKTIVWPAIVVLLVLFSLVLYLVERHNVATSLASLGTTKGTQLAVLSIAERQQDAEAEAFGDGLIETLTSRLARLSSEHSLRVVPASDIRAKHISRLEDAVNEFGVNLALELSVQRSRDMVRVNYALVDARLHRQIDGDTITAPASDPFALEDKVAESVVKALDIQLQPQERAALIARSTAEPAAYDYYLRGRGYLEDYYKPENVESAIAEFLHSIEKDNTYSLAYAGLGEALWWKHQLTKEYQLVSRARLACERAVSLRSDEAQGHYCLGLVNNGTGQYEKAVAEYQLAAQLDPTDDRIYSDLAVIYEKLDRAGAAEETYRHAIQVRPNDWAAYNVLGDFYLRHGRYDDADGMFSQVIALAPESFVGYSNLGLTYLARGQYDRAIPFLEHSVAIRAMADNTSNLGTAYFQLRRYSESAQTFEKAASLDPKNYVVWGNLGDALYWAPGERDKAREAYLKAIRLARKRLAVNSRDHAALAYIAQDYAMTDQQDKAFRSIKAALSNASDDPDLLTTAAIVYNQFGDSQSALGFLERAVSVGASTKSLLDTPNFDKLHDLPRFQQLTRFTDSVK